MNKRFDSSNYPNIVRLTEYINSQSNPKEFARVLFSVIEPDPDCLPHGKDKAKISVG